MPLMNVRTNTSEVQAPDALLKKLSEALASATGKPESYVMTLFDSDAYHGFTEAKLEKLEKLDWFIIWSRTEAGEFKTDEGQYEGNYSSKELNMKDCLLTYRGLPLVIPSNGTDIFSNELEIHFVDETRASLEMCDA